MKRRLLFASNNKNKIEEISNLLQGSDFEVVGMNDIGVFDDIPETGSTLEENSLLKSRYLHDKLQIDVFADDSGLEIYALNNEPGVYSARYSGERDMNKNIQMVLQKLSQCTLKTARFRTVISLILDSKKYFFEGIVEGEIIEELRGEGGFGYDPIFIPKGCQKTFAEMTMEEKNKISHRKQAVMKMVSFLTSN